MNVEQIWWNEILTKSKFQNPNAVQKKSGPKPWDPWKAELITSGKTLKLLWLWMANQNNCIPYCRQSPLCGMVTKPRSKNCPRIEEKGPSLVMLASPKNLQNYLPKMNKNKFGHWRILTKFSEKMSSNNASQRTHKNWMPRCQYANPWRPSQIIVIGCVEASVRTQMPV